MKDHFSPVEKPAPPRPRRPEFFTLVITQSRPHDRMSAVAFQAPRWRAPSRYGSWNPYRLVKMRSLSSRMPGMISSTSSPTEGLLSGHTDRPGSHQEPRQGQTHDYKSNNDAGQLPRQDRNALAFRMSPAPAQHAHYDQDHTGHIHRH